MEDKFDKTYLETHTQEEKTCYCPSCKAGRVIAYNSPIRYKEECSSCLYVVTEKVPGYRYD